jgi:TraM recognition site of TraD and TraG
MTLELGTHIETKKPLYLNEQDRYFNSLIVGPIGSGKTLFLLNKIHQDIKEIVKGNIAGLSIFDSDEYLNDRIKTIAEKEGVKKVIHINPTDEHSVRFNLLNGEYEEVLEAILHMFEDYFFTLDQKQAEFQKEALKHIVFVVKHSDQNVVGLQTIKYCVQSPQFLVQLYYRCLGLINTEEYKETYQGYQKELKEWFKDTVGLTIINGKMKYFFKDPKPFVELGSYLQKVSGNKYLNRVFSSNPSDILDFHALINQGGLLLVSLQKGEIGDSIASMIGKYILSRLEKAALQRSTLEKLPLYHILIDDTVQTFYKEFPRLLVQTRTHRLSVTIAVQSLVRLQEKYGEGFTYLLMDCLKNKFVFGGISVHDARLLSSAINEGRVGEHTFTSKDLIIQDAFVCVAKLSEDSYSLPAKQIKIHYTDAKI